MFNNKKSFSFLLLMFLFFTDNAFAQKQTIGLIEKVKIYPNELILDSKLDTGADSCSLHATNIEEFEKDGKEFVRFNIKDRYGKKQTVEKEVVRHVRIKRLGGKPQVRKVINMGLCVGSVYKVAQVSLVDRGKFNYEMLIGRKFLAGDFVIDPSMTYTQDPVCQVDADVSDNKALVDSKKTKN